MKAIEIKFRSDWFRLEIDEKTGAGRIESNLKTGLPVDRDYDAAIDGVESLILAHACAGIDVTAKKYVRGIETACEAITDNA